MGEVSPGGLVALPGGRGNRDAETSLAPRAEAVAFDGCFGVLHRPAPAQARGVAVVLCSPVGRDARCAYRPLWVLAETLAEAGLSVLRYEHRGTGDSLPLDPEADQWAVWRAGVEQAAAFARAHTGCEGLVLAGLRLGASLAAAAAERVRPDALMLLAPVTAGGPWLRELQFAASMLRAQPARSGPRDGPVEADGVRLSSAAVKSLQGFDLRKLPMGERPIFLASADKTDQLVAAMGLNATVAPFEGYDTLFKDSHINAPPLALYARAAAWLESLPAAASRPAAAAPVPPAVLSTPEWVERPVVFGEGLRGILCFPAKGGAVRGVIMGNTGGDPRAGIGSFNAQASRALAARGAAALRFDFAGIGESDFSGGWLSHVYETPREADYAAASAVLTQHGCREIVLSGVCSAGYHALRAAIADERYCGVMVMNAAKLVWRVGETLEIVYDEDHRSSRVFLHALLKPAAWGRLLNGEVDVRAVAGTVAKRLLRRWSFRLHDPESRALRGGVTRLTARGVPVRVVVGREDRALDELELHFGRDGQRLARLPGVSVAVTPGLDHGLFFPESQAMALKEVLDFVEACGAPRPLAKRHAHRKPAAPMRVAAG